MKARRFFTALGIFLVTVVAGAISYRHQSELALTNGQPAMLAAIWPACVDGLVMSCGIAIATDRAGGYRPRTWALLGFWVGVVVSVLTNWLATSGGPIAHAVSAFPAVAFLIAVESLSAKPRAPKRAPKQAPELASVPPLAAPIPVVSVASPAVAAHATERVRATPVRPSRKTPAAITAAGKVAAAAKRLPNGTAAQIAARAGVSESTVRRHRPATEPATVASPSEPAPAQTNGHRLLAEVSA